MKSKTLLIAAASLVAGVMSSEAQVYSANIVGYVNVPVPAGQLALVSNPLDNGTNTANDVLSSLPNKSTVQIWSGSGFTIYTKTTAGFTPTNPSIPVGMGFFVKSATAATNTFVGNVVPNPGGSATNALPGGVLALVGSQLPVAGTFGDLGTNSFNLAATLPNKSTVQLWNGAGYTIYTKTTAGFTPSVPPYTPGQGFFVKFPANGTNTLVGSVAVPVGASVTNTFTANIYALVGSPVPYSDTITGTNLNLNLANNSQILVWTGTTYAGSTKSFGNWSANLAIAPGQGFFVKSATTTNWVQTFNLQ